MTKEILTAMRRNPGWNTAGFHAQLLAIQAQILEATANGGGGASGDTAATLAFYSDTLAELQGLLAAIESGDASDITLQAVRDATYEVRERLGALTEAAPGTDTASSGLNGRLQRLAQRLGEVLGRLPLSLGQKTKDNSLPVVLAGDGDPLAIAVAFNAGVASATTQRVILANDGPAVAQLLQIAAASRGTLTAHNTSAANAAATFTIAAPGAGLAIQICSLLFGYSANPEVAGTLTMASAGLTSIVLPITTGGAGTSNLPLRVNANTSLTVTLSAGGVGVVGNCSAIYSLVSA